MPKFYLHLEKWAVPWVAGLSLVALVIDELIGNHITFPISLIFPVALLAWFRPGRYAIMLAAALCYVRVGLATPWLSIPEPDLSDVLLNALVRVAVLFLVAGLIARVAKQRRALAAQPRALTGTLSMCGFCKKILNEKGEWELMETYISRHSEARFNHTVCPECQKATRPALLKHWNSP